MSFYIRYVILFIIAIIGIGIFAVYASQHNAGVIPIEECARYLGNTFCDFLYNATVFS